MRLSLFLLAAFAAILWIAYPALAQYAFQSDSVHHRQRVRLSSPPSDFISPLETPGLGLVIQQGDRMFIFQAWPPAAVEIKASGSIGNHEASTAHARGVYSHRLHRETRCGAKRCVVRLLQYRGWRLEELRVRNV